MNTTDEIMALADAFATAHRFRENSAAKRSSLRTAVNELVEQAAWAHHTPALLTEADAAADLAGLARPGAEQWVEFVMHEVQVLASTWALVGSRFDDGTCLDDFERQKTELRAILYTKPQASQPLTAQEVEAIIARHDYQIHGDRARYIVRMTEQAHGIGAAQKGKP